MGMVLPLVAQMSANHTSGGRPSDCAGGDRCRCLGCRTKLSLLITTTSSKIGEIGVAVGKRFRRALGSTRETQPQLIRKVEHARGGGLGSWR